MHSNILTNGQVLMGGSVSINRDGRIVSASCERGAADIPTLRCPNSVVAPRFINLHEHLNYSSGSAAAAPEQPFASRREWQSEAAAWPGVEVRRTRSRPVLTLVELRHLLRGTTSIAGRGRVPGLLRNLDSGREKIAKNITFPFGRRYFEDAQCPERPILPRRRAVLAHVGEGVNAASLEEIECLLHQQNNYPSGPPLAFVHSIGVNEMLAEQMASLGVSVVWSPCSNMKLYGLTVPYSLLQEYGVNVALASDWIVSGSPSVLDEIDCIEPAIPPAGTISKVKLLEMLTTAPAVALGAEDLGIIQSGAWADILVIPMRGFSAEAILESILTPSGYQQDFVFGVGQLVFSSQQASYLAELPNGGDCYELRRTACAMGGWICGKKAIRKALNLPDLDQILCPISEPSGSILQHANRGGEH